MEPTDQALLGKESKGPFSVSERSDNSAQSNVRTSGQCSVTSSQTTNSPVNVDRISVVYWSGRISVVAALALERLTAAAAIDFLVPRLASRSQFLSRPQHDCVLQFHPIGAFYDVSPKGEIVYVRFNPGKSELWLAEFPGL